ncbi:MAG: hypothetical protein WCK65_09805 [Rhodospirillaceae bacterium]
MTTRAWPLDLRPTGMTFYVQTLTASFAAAMTAQVTVAERAGAHWRADMAMWALPAQVVQIDTMLASGGTVLLPVFGKLTGHGVGPAFNTLAAEIGPTRFDDDTLFDDGFGFSEGAGAVSVIGGCLSRLALGGCRPGSLALTVGDLIQTSAGRAHIIISVSPADINGVALCRLAPPLRSPPTLAAPVLDNCRIAMMVVGSDAGDGQTEPPARTTYTLNFEEDLSWPTA